MLVGAILVRLTNLIILELALLVLMYVRLVHLVQFVLPVPQATTQLRIVSASHVLPFQHTMQALKLAFVNLARS